MTSLNDRSDPAIFFFFFFFFFFCQRFSPKFNKYVLLTIARHIFSERVKVFYFPPRNKM